MKKFRLFSMPKGILPFQIWSQKGSKVVSICFCFLFVVVGILNSQTSSDRTQINISTKDVATHKMNPFLNGVARNHYKGYFATGASDSHWKETRFEEKVELYNGISNNFSNGGGILYRIGHDISDGSQKDASAGQHSGWHWATDYGNGFNPEYIATSPHITAQNAVQPLFPLLPNSRVGIKRLGAGLHRFCYTNQTRSEYSGFGVTINYENSIELNYDDLPKSHSIVFDPSQINLAPDYTDAVKLAVKGLVAPIGRYTIRRSKYRSISGSRASCWLPAERPWLL